MKKYWTVNRTINAPRCFSIYCSIIVSLAQHTFRDTHAVLTDTDIAAGFFGYVSGKL